MATSILALEKDLFFSVKMRDTLHHHGLDVIAVRSLPTFEEHLAATGDEKPALVIVNSGTKGVDWEAAIREARAQNYPVLVFGSHMDLEAREKALQAGCAARRRQLQIQQRYGRISAANAQSPVYTGRKR